MTTKYTKRQMNQDIAEVNSQLEAAIIERAELERLDSFGVKVDGDRWNELHDIIDCYLPDAIRQIESRYAKRDWTAADYTSQSLAMSNID